MGATRFDTQTAKPPPADGDKYLERFFEMLMAERQSAANTVDAYRRDLRDFTVFVKRRSRSLADVDAALVRAYLQRLDQAAAATVLTIALALLAGHWLWHGQLRGRLVEIDRAEPIAVQLQIDVNAADWAELSLLPGVGEQLARRIVAERTENGPFRDWDDLLRVRGIGPKTLEGMKPLLLPMADLDATAGNDVRGGGGRRPEGHVN